MEAPKKIYLKTENGEVEYIRADVAGYYPKESSAAGYSNQKKNDKMGLHLKGLEHLEKLGEDDDDN